LKSDFAEAYNGRAKAEYFSGQKEVACNDLKIAASLGYTPALEIIEQLCK
jgi:hypothetical protein